MGEQGRAHHQAIKDLSRAAKKCRQWLCTKRNDATWAPTKQKATKGTFRAWVQEKMAAKG